MSDGDVSDGDACALCAGDCVCESGALASLSDEELDQRRRDRARLLRLYREASRPLPEWARRWLRE